MTEPRKDYLLHDFPDRAIRRLLEDPRNLREIVADLLPDLADRFDFEHVETVERDFLLEDWRRRESDMLFRLPFRDDAGDQAALVCVLIEHQSRPDPIMPLRILVYAVLYWEQEWKAWERSHAQGETLRPTPVIPIVFHTGDRPWGSNRELAEVMAWPESLRAFVPQWPILFWDLGERSPQELMEAAGDWLRVLAVVRAEHQEPDEFVKVYETVLKELEALASREHIRWHDLMEFILSWAFRRRPKEESKNLTRIATASYKSRQRKKEIRTMANALGKTWEDLFVEQRELGKAEGKAEGELQTAREILRSLLENRFGELPPDVVDRIAMATDVEMLKSRVRDVLRLQSLDDIEL